MHTAPAVKVVSPVSKSGVKVTSGGGWLSYPAPGAVKTQGIHGYNAVDLAASVGTPIRAAAAGEVIVSKNSGWNGGYGQYIVIRHSNGAQTLYGHLSANSVGVGAYVSQGEVIGLMGNTGKSTGPHLHFEVRGATNPF
jgi:murein DD-endopeptidase MepM/ murein hydrolase activator NlpD